MRRHWVFAALAAPLAAVAVGLLAFVDFAHEPRNESIGDDFSVTNSGCLDWWCRAGDVVPVAIAVVLLLAALLALRLGLRRR